MTTPKRPRDTNQLAKMVVDLSTLDDVELRELRRKKHKQKIEVPIVKQQGEADQK